MTPQQPHPQRCETCMNTECDLHEEGKGNRSPDTGYEWDHYHWYHKIIDEKGCASHSAAELVPEQPPFYYPILEGELRCMANCDHKDPDEMINKVMRRGTAYPHPHEIVIQEQAASEARADEREKVLALVDHAMENCANRFYCLHQIQLIREGKITAWEEEESLRQQKDTVGISPTE